MKHFKNIKSFDDLKEQFKRLARENHPDAGGDAETMKEINVEYDALFPIWKGKKEAESGMTVSETASSTRSQFYTEFGWEGSRHDWSRSLKEVAQIVRAYVKEKYPTYKFSVRTAYASMCQELYVELKESPIEIYKPFSELTDDDFRKIAKALFPWDWNIDEKLEFLNSSREAKIEAIKNSSNRYAYVLNEITESVIKDVDAFVKSYNYEDCDGMIDYFHVDFYYFGCCKDNGKNIKIVPKTARIKNADSAPAKKADQPATDSADALEVRYTYQISKGEDTRDGSVLWIVRIAETLDKSAYIAENQKMKSLGGYYSKFKHGFIFRVDPTNLLTA